MTAKHRVLRNSVWGVASEGAGGLFFFLAFVLVARYLGTFQFGIFSFVFAFVGVFQVVADFGFTNILIRDMARDKADAANIFSAAALLVAIIALTILVIMCLLSYWWAATSEALWACLIMSASVAINFQALVFGAVCRAHEDMGFNAASNITHKLIILLLVLGAIHLHAGLVGIMLAFLLGATYQYLFFGFVVRTRYFPISWRFDPPYWKYLLKESYLVGMALVFRRGTAHAATLLLTAFTSPQAVGLFNAAFRIIHVIEMLPFTLSLPLYPSFARLAKESRARLFQALGDAMRIFTLISIPLFLWVLLLAPAVISITFGPAYADAVPPLRILSLVIFLIFPTGIYIYAFSALNQQRFYTISTAVCLVVNIVLNIALIPAFHEQGAAAAVAAGELSFFVSGFVLLHRQGLKVSILALVSKPLLATAVASPIMLAATQSSSVLALIAHTLAYGLTYLLLIVLFKCISAEELALLRSAFGFKA